MVKINKRDKQKNLWVDIEFLTWLKNLKAKKQLEGEEISSLTELTKQMIQTEAIQEVENQILKNHVSDIKIKLDARRLLR